jgi:hypothetical protein
MFCVTESEEEEEEEEEEEAEQAPDVTGLQTPSGLETPSGLASVTSTVPGGLETPDFLELRKQREVTADTEADDGRPKQLYQVVPEREANIRGFLGSERVYDVSAVGGGAHRGPVLGEESRGSKVRFMGPRTGTSGLLTFSLLCVCGSARLAMWRWLWTRRSSRDCRRSSCSSVTRRAGSRRRRRLGQLRRHGEPART